MKVGMTRHAKTISINQHYPRCNRMAIGALYVNAGFELAVLSNDVFSHNALRIEDQARMGSRPPKP